VTTFGKPNKTTFEYAKQIVDAQAAKMGVEISDYYMIGDNPPGDILGANLMGWKSILVRTGVYQGEVLPNEMKPQFEVNDMLDAAKLITNF
jgi:ribonucleotide monophosphatase NagD (HAD superfamily)